MPLDEIVLISDPEVLRIPIQENHDVLLDARDFFHVGSDSSSQGESNQPCFLRKSVLSKLSDAEKSLPHGYRLSVREGYRSLQTQKKYFAEYSDKLRKLHPDWDAKHLHQEASKFVAPPEIIPPHCTGGAVDLTLMLKNGQELNMGTALNADPEEARNACYTFATTISPSNRANRQILVEAMSKAGLVNYPTEWWHWSYGDRYWAFLRKKPFALFGHFEP